MNYDIFRNKLNTAPFHIYGTGIVGVSIYVVLKELYRMTPVSFLVTNGNGNPQQIEQIPVQEAVDASLDGNLILVAAPAEHHIAIGQTLRGLGAAESQIMYVDSALENQIMEDYYRRLPAFETAGELLEKLENTGHVKSSNAMACGDEDLRRMDIKAGWQDIRVYQAKCHVDRPLASEAAVSAYICPIQVGASLTEQSVADRRDDTGDNISHKNRDYCELTATYHTWKNDTSSYKGICHYRRVFALEDVELSLLVNIADVILPYPTIHFPNIMDQHSRYVGEAEWQALRQAVTECEPAYAAELDQIFSDRYFYNFNMLVARAEVFDEYARWMFSILKRTEEIIEERGILPSKRYAGYLGENLTTFYFRRNRKTLRIVHAGRTHLI